MTYVGDIKLMGRILEWDNEPTEVNPCCKGCGNNGWTLDSLSSYWVCGKCMKPSQAYLRLCPCCQLVWLPTIEIFQSPFHDKIYVENFPRELQHPECADPRDLE